MLGFLPAFAAATDIELRLRHDWLTLLPGLFAQGGIAEEVVFRGYLFRRIREGRTFRRAASLSSIPFVAVHLLLFLHMDFVVAMSALLVSLSLSIPLAWLFERSGDSVWLCALVHFVVQGAIEVIDVPSDELLPLALAWMLLGATAPWLLFLLPRPEALSPRPE